MKFCLVKIAIVFLLFTATPNASKIFAHPLTSPYLFNVYFSDTVRGWILGTVNDAGIIYRTTDGGETWHEQYRTNEGLYKIRFADQQSGWAVGSNGTILHTNNGGLAWERQISGSKALLTGVAAIDAQTAWVSGANGTLLLTKDEGRTWSPQKVNTNVGISDIGFAGTEYGVAVGYGTILITRDGGRTWIINNSPRKQLSSVVITNGSKGWITAGPALLRITDNGKTLHEIIPPLQGQLAGISFVDAQYGWVAKSRGVEGDIAHIKSLEKLSSESFILSTKDGGLSWQEQFHITSDKDHSAWALSIFFIDSSNGWVVGRAGLVLKTVDGGKHWKRIRI